MTQDYLRSLMQFIQVLLLNISFVDILFPTDEFQNAYYMYMCVYIYPLYVIYIYII